MNRNRNFFLILGLVILVSGCGNYSRQKFNTAMGGQYFKVEVEQPYAGDPELRPIIVKKRPLTDEEFQALDPSNPMNRLREYFGVKPSRDNVQAETEQDAYNLGE